MIAPTVTTPPAGLAASGPSDPSLAAPGGLPVDLGEAEGAQNAAAVDARIAALVARGSTPEDEALERRREAFDLVTEIRAETEREINALRDLAMQQMKNDDEQLKKWIELI